MKKFDIAYKFTVVGIQTIEDFSNHDAADTFKQDLIDAIQAELGDGSILLELSQAVHQHNASQVEREVADLMERKARGLSEVSSGAAITPYFTPSPEPEVTEPFGLLGMKDDEDSEDTEPTEPEAKSEYPRNMGNNEHRCGAY